MIGAALQELLGMVGARYPCVADRGTGRVLAEFDGGCAVVPSGLPAGGSGAVRFRAEPDADADELDDLPRDLGAGAHRETGGSAARLPAALRRMSEIEMIRTTKRTHFAEGCRKVRLERPSGRLPPQLGLPGRRAR
jgi:hypothetical protein